MRAAIGKGRAFLSAFFAIRAIGRRKVQIYKVLRQTESAEELKIPFQNKEDIWNRKRK